MPRFQSPLNNYLSDFQVNWPPLGVMSIPWALLPIFFWIPRKEPHLTEFPQRHATCLEPSNYLLIFPVSGLPTFPSGPLWWEAPVSRIFFLQLSLNFTGKWAPPPCSPSGSLGREKLHLQSQWFIHLFISVGVPNKEPSHEKRGKTFFNHPRSPKWMEGLHTMGCSLIAQGCRLRPWSLCPSAMQPSARYLPP